ncbi:MAG: type 4a pilus biogenesis protein PilO [Oligoflexia bacterium]|nr:type 4a pilus biogenesis protein PilO [Oligoflexia bacterium]
MELNRIKDIIEKVPFLFLLVLYLGYLGMGYHGFLNDPASELNLKKAELKASQEDLAKLSRKVEETREFIRSLNVKREEMRRLAQQLEDTKAVLTETLDVPAFMKLVLTEAQRVGLNVQSIRPGEASRGEHYAQQIFDVNFHGVYIQLIGFLDRLANLQKIVRVDDFMMKPISASTAKYVELEGVLQLKVFRYIGTKADEIAHKDNAALSGAAPGIAGGAAAPAGASPAATSPAGVP